MLDGGFGKSLASEEYRKPETIVTNLFFYLTVTATDSHLTGINVNLTNPFKTHFILALLR